MPKFHPVPAGFSLVMPHRLHTCPLLEIAHTSVPTDTDRKPTTPSACGGSLGTLASTCQCDPSGKADDISRRTANRPMLSSAQMPSRPTLICLNVTPLGGSTGCQASPCGFSIVMPYRKKAVPLLPIAHTFVSDADPQQIDTNG